MAKEIMFQALVLDGNREKLAKKLNNIEQKVRNYAVNYEGDKFSRYFIG